MNDIQLDIGENLAKLLEQVAGAIGTTADKVFPWYVKQAIISGCCDLVVYPIAIFVSFFLVVKFSKHLRATDEESWLFPIIFCSLIGIVLSLALVVCFSNIIGCLVNPEYAAMKTLLTQLNPPAK